jgi:ribonuclease Z
LNEYESSGNVYKDKNLSVTPVIVLPENDTNEEASSPGAGIKRKHDDQEDSQTYSRKVVSQMFTNTDSKKKGTSKKKTAETASPPDQTMDAECTPRHPLGNTEKKPNNQRDFLSKALPSTTPFSGAISYICEGTSVPRKFNKAAAVALGIKPGPLYGQLQKGIAITLEDGRVITQDMVCEPEIPGHVFMVVDCPNVSYIDALVKTRAFERFQDDQPKAMIHMVGDDVLQDERYKAWLTTFGTTTDVK